MSDITSIDWISEYKKKAEFLNLNFDSLEMFPFYRDIFPVGSFEKKGSVEEKPNGLVMNITDDGTSKTNIVFDDLKEFGKFKNEKFVVTNGLAYLGKRRLKTNAFKMYALIFDLDYVVDYNLSDLLFQMQGGILPMASYITLSGGGVHVYYVFDEPIPLYSWVQSPLNELKKGLSDIIWNQYTSIERNKQYQSIHQSFRMVGSPTKLGAEYPVIAFKTGGKVDINYLNEFVKDNQKFDFINLSKTRLTLEQAKEKYPKWYQSRIVEKRPKGCFYYNIGMYEKWIDYVLGGAFDGNRYHCLCVLFANAVKCNISKEQAIRDAEKLMPFLNSKTNKLANEFTMNDLYAATKFYNKNSHLLSADMIRYKTKIPLPIDKRNGRTQTLHLKIARATRDVIHENWRNTQGRPIGSGTAKSKIIEWKKNNPNGKKVDCHRQTFLDPKTVRKWWNYEND